MTRNPVKNGQLSVTRAVCPTCRSLVFARILSRDNKIIFEKHCPEHGVSEAVVAGDASAWLDAERFHRKASIPLKFEQEWKTGCPDDCGFCPQHEQHVCLPILEITDHCDMACPICLVQTPNSRHIEMEQVEKILDRLIETEGSIDVLNLSGGEPTLHPEFKKIVDLCLARREIVRVSVSTNGQKLSQDENLRTFLKERNVVVSLQFDGFDPEAARLLRGGFNLEERRQLIDEMTRLDAPMSLTLTLARGVSESGLAEAVSLLFERDNILSLMIQPAAFCGTARKFPESAARRIFIPEAIELLASHSGGRIKVEDFSPLPCSHPNCFSLTFFLKTNDGNFTSIKRFVDTDTYLDIIRNRSLIGTDMENFRKIEHAVFELWSGPAALTPDGEKALKAMKRLICDAQEGGCFDPAKAVQVAERSIKSIFIHAFMDEETFDLNRARKCCQVYPLTDGRFMPACVYNVLHR